jgi:hypothetical protein
MMSRVCILLLAIGQAAPKQYNWLARLRRIAIGLDFFSCMSYPGLFVSQWLMAFLHLWKYLHVFGGPFSCIWRLLYPNFHSAFESSFGYLQRLEDGGCFLINVR